MNVGSLIITRYQTDDLLNILLSNDYIVEIRNNDDNTFLINIYDEIGNKKKENENDKNN